MVAKEAARGSRGFRGGSGLGRRAARGSPAGEELGRRNGQLGTLVLRTAGDVGLGRGASSAVVEAVAQLAGVRVKVADDTVGLAEGVGGFAGTDGEDGGREDGHVGHFGGGVGLLRWFGWVCKASRGRDVDGIMAL